MRCFIIRLKENEHSCKMAQDCYNQAIKFGITPIFFDAINGNDAEMHYQKENIRQGKKFKKERPGVLGCFFSHFYLWKQCVQDNIPYVILEHDGYIIKPFDNRILSQFDDVLTLDRLDPFSNNYEKYLDQEKLLPTSIQQYKNLDAKVLVTKIYPKTTNYLKGAYAYIIKPQAAQKIIDHISVHGHLPADQQINSNILNLEAVEPSLARLHPHYAIGTNIKDDSLTRNLGK
jgi:glycosyl transferase, family 25